MDIETVVKSIRFLWDLTLIFSASWNPLLLHLLLLCTGIKIPVLDQLKRILFRDIGLCLIEDRAIKALSQPPRGNDHGFLWTDETDETYIMIKVENEGFQGKKWNGLIYIIGMFAHVCAFASPWSSGRLNNQIFDLGLEGRFNPRNGEKVFSQVAFMQFCLLVQFYRNVSLQFQHPG